MKKPDAGERIATVNKPAHFIAAEHCRFGRASTRKGLPFVVSSVGDYWPPGATGRHTIGYKRTYETLVFKGWRGKRCLAKECGCRVPLGFKWLEIDGVFANTKAECLRNHAAMVRKYLPRRALRTKRSKR